VRYDVIQSSARSQIGSTVRDIKGSQIYIRGRCAPLDAP